MRKKQQSQTGRFQKKRIDDERLANENSIDIMKLPPRSNTIKKKEDQNRPWWKIKYPILTLLVFIFILLPISVVGYVYKHHEEFFTKEGSIIVPSNKFEKVKIQSTKGLIDKETRSTSKINSRKEKKVIPNDPIVEKKQVKHIVKEGETLFSISMKYYGSRNGEEIIQEENNLSSIDVEPGQVLVIPLDVDLNK